MIKRILGFFLFISIISMPVAQANVVKIPSNVLEKFQQKFPEAEQVHWTKIDRQYIVAFVQNKAEKKIVSFDMQGKWRATETELEESALPCFVQSYIINNYSATAKIESIHLIEKPAQQYFSIGMETENGFVTLEIDTKGHLIEL